MTFEIRRPQKGVVLSPQNKAILEAYHWALKVAFTGNESLEYHREDPQVPAQAVGGDAPRAVAEDTALQGREGIRSVWWVPAAETVNKGVRFITGTNAFNTGEYILYPFSVELDQRAHDVYEGYEDYVTGLFDRYKPSFFEEKNPSKLAEAHEIAKGHVLVLELLLRMSALALSTGFQESRDGEKLVKAAGLFQSRVVDHALVAKKGLSDFEKELVTTHRQKLKAILLVVRVLKSLKANADSVSRAQRFLKSAIYVLKTNLILLLAPNLTDPSKIKSEAQIRRTLKEYENELLRENASKEGEDRVLSVISASGSKANQLRQFYALIEQAGQLLTLFGGIEDMQTVAGWIPVLCGGLDMAQVAGKFSEFGEAFVGMVEIESLDDFRIQHPLARKLPAIIGSLESADDIAWTKISKQLTSLTDKEQAQLIRYVAGSAMDNIIRAQEQLGIQAIDAPNLMRLFPASRDRFVVKYQRQATILPAATSLSLKPEHSKYPNIAAIQQHVASINRQAYWLALIFTPRFMFRSLKTRGKFFDHPQVDLLCQSLTACDALIDQIARSNESNNPKDTLALTSAVKKVNDNVAIEVFRIDTRLKKLRPSHCLYRYGQAAKTLNSWKTEIEAQQQNIQTRLGALGAHYQPEGGAAFTGTLAHGASAMLAPPSRTPKERGDEILARLARM